MDDTDNVIPFDRESELKREIREIEGKLAAHELGWIDGSIMLAERFVEARGRYPSDNAFNSWLSANGLARQYNDHDRAALIHMGQEPETMRAVLEETSSRSYRLTWDRYRNRFGRAAKPTTSIVKLPVSAPVAGPETKMASVQPVVSSQAIVAEPTASDDAIFYPLPEKSKLRDALGAEAADVLISRFKHSRMFIGLLGSNASPNDRSKLKYLAMRCQQPDYPAELFVSQTWSPQLLYPHLPKRFIGMLPVTLVSLHKQHTVLVETERRFMQTPEFGITDPPLAAYNKAYAIYTALVNARKGHTVDPAAIHRPSFGDDEGKPPVVVRGTKLWPAETGTGYRYDDLRCACGLADSVISAFDEQRPSVSSKTLKLRHIRSWLAGGYNSTGATPDGTLKAFNAVIQAWSWNVSEEMQNPLPSMIKNDGDQR